MKTPTTQTAANDTRIIRAPGAWAGKDCHKAIRTIASAIGSGDMKRARNAARYVWPRLGVTVAVPATDATDVWVNVVTVLRGIAARLDDDARRAL